MAVKTGKRAFRPGKLLLFVLMILVTLVYIYPFFWLFISCFKSNAEIFGHSLALPSS